MASRAYAWLAFGAISAACATGAFETANPMRMRVTVEPVDGHAAVVGAVFHADTGDALEGTEVRLWCECLNGTPGTVTDARGRFSFRDLPPGNYQLEFLHAGRSIATAERALSEGQQLRVNALLPREFPPRTIT